MCLPVLFLALFGALAFTSPASSQTTGEVLANARYGYWMTLPTGWVATPLENGAGWSLTHDLDPDWQGRVEAARLPAVFEQTDDRFDEMMRHSGGAYRLSQPLMPSIAALGEMPGSAGGSLPIVGLVDGDAVVLGHIAGRTTSATDLAGRRVIALEAYQCGILYTLSLDAPVVDEGVAEAFDSLRNNVTVIARPERHCTAFRADAPG
jgi:hypothetical protein